MIILLLFDYFATLIVFLIELILVFVLAIVLYLLFFLLSLGVDTFERRVFRKLSLYLHEIVVRFAYALSSLLTRPYFVGFHGVYCRYNLFPQYATVG